MTQLDGSALRPAGKRFRRLGALAILALAACDAAPMGPAGAAAPGEGALIAVGGGPHGPRTACFSCHGLKGEGDGSATPRLAGLSAGYLEKQMHDYALERRPDAVMSGVSKGLTTEERRAVARHYAALPVATAPTPAATRDQLALGQRLYAEGVPARALPACRSCHGAPLVGAGPANPALGGQPAAYTVEQLRRWRLGKRRNDPRGVMLAVAERMTEPEMEAVAAYLSSVRS